MYLCDGKIGNNYKVSDIELPTNMEKRLEALGMTRGTSVAVLNSKSHGVLIVKVRGTKEKFQNRSAAPKRSWEVSPP